MWLSVVKGKIFISGKHGILADTTKVAPARSAWYALTRFAFTFVTFVDNNSVILSGFTNVFAMRII